MSLANHRFLISTGFLTSLFFAVPSVHAQEITKPTTEMQAVLDKLAALGAKPYSILSVPEARTQASPAHAAHAVQWNKRMSSNPEWKSYPKCIMPVVRVSD